MANEQKQNLSGDWQQLRVAVKNRWGQLTDQDLTAVEGDTERLIGLIQQKTGEARDQIEKFLKECSSQTSSVVQHLHDGYDAATGSVASHPATSIFLAFGVGCAMGLLLGHALAEPPRVTRSRLSAFAHQMLEAMHHHMPKALA